MIAYIEGEVVADTTIGGESTESIVVLNSGIGYELICSQNTFDDFFAQESIKAWVYTHVREDALQLFGFATPLEKQLFTFLLKVNGIGPKMAIKVLSGAKIVDIISMIEKGDAKSLAKLPKVGKKKSEQIVLTLKGKLDWGISSTSASVTAPEGGSSLGSHARASTEGSIVKRQIVSALVNLGFKSSDVESVVGELAENIEFQDGVKEGLSALAGGG